MTRRSLPSFALLAAAGALLVNSLQRPVAAWQPPAPLRQMWEYKSIIEIAQNDIAVSESGLLNQAGLVGWELVSVIDGPAPRAKQYILKRPRTARD